MHGGRDVAQLLRAAGGQQQAQRVFALRLLVERADDFAQVIDAAVGGLRAGAGFERGGIAPAHHARQHADFEEGDELLLRVDLAARGGRGLRPPCRAQHAVAVERQQAGEEAGPRCLRRRLQRKHLDMALADSQMVAVPCNRALDDLPVYAGIAAELVLQRPILQG